jgi:hypothetical protein
MADGDVVQKIAASGLTSPTKLVSEAASDGVINLSFRNNASGD